MQSLLCLAVILATTVFGPGAGAAQVSAPVRPPQPMREFRGVWVATVRNIDWPSAPGLSTARQQAELEAILDQAVALRLNAVLFQVRPACDAMYASVLEPWSEYLTGVMGRAPKPYYDPLAFAVQQAHRRGLELHAWFNPFRARHPSATSPLSPTHISRTQPALVKSYAGSLWLDPGEPAVRRHSLRVILDVVQRYAVDGVHLDDYFYPYPARDARGTAVDFPDGPTWARYQRQGGKLSRADWRRSNVNTFVRDLYATVKKANAAVHVGLSPFGIWRPGQPAQIKGFDAWAALYADSREWLRRGWIDYFVPQLYWGIAPPPQSFPVLLDWWLSQNTQNRHVLAGMSCYRHDAAELAAQVAATRGRAAARGQCLWSARVLAENRHGIATHFRTNVYAHPALPPAAPWLDRQPPAAPKVVVRPGAGSAARVSWEPGDAEPARLWVWQTRTGSRWTTAILPGQVTSQLLPRQHLPDAIAVSSVDRARNLGPATVARPASPP
ncbi:MAG: family 10 glycosylhydrolase [Verrucomicrobia bacterium]|nr:family 10 glycosylhydrolase [Verrucomicrobiota bacterium]